MAVITSNPNETEGYWVFRLSPSSGILENRKHDVSETGSLFFPR
jgi:hypothetical protein